MTFSRAFERSEGRTGEPRALIILMDGTWNDETGKDGDGVVTNIVKLFRCLGPDTDTQITRYFRGVGNDEENSRFRIMVDGAFGTDERRIRNDAYSTIAKLYRPGDRLFIFGFSRGAASARLLAAQIASDGLPRKGRIFYESKLNRFTRNVERHFIKCEVVESGEPVDVEFLGVWDTVGAFGIPVRLLGIPFHKINLFRDMHVAKNVKRAVHLVSIDETRTAFEPTLMNYNPDVVEEVWAAGVHSDVGGGYKRDTLGRITLQYMVHCVLEQAERIGVALSWDDTLLRGTLASDGDFHFHFHGIGYKKALRKIYVMEDDEPSKTILPKIHASMLPMRSSRDVYSVVEKDPWFGRKTVRLPHIVYNPANVSQLHGKFEMVGEPNFVLPSSERRSASTREPSAGRVADHVVHGSADAGSP